MGARKPNAKTRRAAVAPFDVDHALQDIEQLTDEVQANVQHAAVAMSRRGLRRRVAAPRHGEFNPGTRRAHRNPNRSDAVGLRRDTEHRGDDRRRPWSPGGYGGNRAVDAPLDRAARRADRLALLFHEIDDFQDGEPIRVRRTRRIAPPCDLRRRRTSSRPPFGRRPGPGRAGRRSDLTWSFERHGILQRAACHATIGANGGIWSTPGGCVAWLGRPLHCRQPSHTTRAIL